MKMQKTEWDWTGDLTNTSAVFRAGCWKTIVILTDSNVTSL